MDINLFKNHERDALNYQIRQQRMSLKDSNIVLKIDKSSRQAITRSLNDYFCANGLNAKESWFLKNRCTVSFEPEKRCIDVFQYAMVHSRACSVWNQEMAGRTINSGRNDI